MGISVRIAVEAPEDDASAGVVRAASERRSRASCARLPHVPHAGAVAPDVYWLTPVQRSGRRNPVTDPQLLTLTIAIVIPLSLLLYSNSKITECKETLRAEMASMRLKIPGELRELKTLLKMHELQHHR